MSCQLFIISLLLYLNACTSSDLPLAPYNVKVLCRQGVRFSRVAQTATQCPSSSTACGYIEMKLHDSKGLDTTGVYDCVDGGILAQAGSEEDEETDANTAPLFTELCGAQPGCSTLHLDALNPAYLKYIVTHYDVKLEDLHTKDIRFCCSLFHSTLQKLVSSGKDRLPAVSAPPVHCQSEVCGTGAVGCLLHTKHSTDEDDYEYEDRRRRRRSHDDNDDDYGVDVELSFDYEDAPFELVTRTPPTTTAVPTTESFLNDTLSSNASSTLPSLRLPFGESKKVKKPTPPTKTKNGIKYAVVDDTEDSQEDGDGDGEEESHCVYRHLNDELYRYCLLVHQRKDGDRCYHHQGNTICCCFVPPDKETCDPTEMELTRSPPVTRMPVIKVTPPAPTTSTSTTSTTTTTTTTTTSTTTTSTTTPPPTTTMQAVTTPQPINKRCRVTYPKSRTSGSKARPLLVCDSAATAFPVIAVIAVFVLLLLN